MATFALQNRELFEGTGWYFKAREIYIKNLLKEVQGRVLDVGCGAGMVGRILERQEVWGVDEDPVAVSKACHYMVATRSSAEKLVFSNNHFDAVTAFDVLEHLQDDDKSLEEIRRVLKPGGKLIMTVPLHPSFWSDHDVECGHYRRYDEKLMENKLKETGFIILKQTRYMALGKILSQYIKHRKVSYNPLVDFILLNWVQLEEYVRRFFPGLPGLTGVFIAKKEKRG